MKFLSVTLLLCVASWNAFAQNQYNVLTQENVSSTLDLMIAAQVRKDADSVVSHLAPDAVIIVKFSPEMGGLQLFSKNDYRELLEAAFALYGNNASSRVSGVEVKVDPDGLGATVTSTTEETVSMGGQTVTSTSFGATIFELIQGKPMVVLDYARIGEIR